MTAGYHAPGRKYYRSIRAASLIRYGFLGNSVREIKSIYIKEFSAKVKDNKIAEYRVNAKISFVVD
ncbi:MAG: dodecin family protein [Bacteroidetes bacterium]|nr:dodecin family protein [Bacteroidota bacterium]